MMSQWAMFRGHNLIMISHGLHYSVGLMTLVLQLDIFLHSDFKGYNTIINIYLSHIL